MISMINNEQQPQYFLQIPMFLNGLGLTTTDKQVYAAAYTMLNVNKICFMSNARIAEVVEVKPNTVAHSISKLVDMNLLKRKLVYKEGTKEVDKRYLYLPDTPLDENTLPHVSEYNTPLYKNTKPHVSEYKDNRLLNKSINRLNNNMSSSNEHDHSKAKEIIAYLNDKADKHFRNTQSNYKTIEARLKDYSIDDLKRVIDNKCSSWLNTNMDKYLRIETLFRASKIDGYLNEKVDTRNTGGEVHGIDF